jgi:signal transduction histidine kinase
MPGTAGRELRILPMVSDGEPLGVVEVVAPAVRLADREDALEVVVQLSSLLLRAAIDRAEVARSMRRMESLVGLTTQLMSAENPIDALRLGVDLLASELDVPVAGVRPDRSGEGWYVAAVAGAGARRRAAFRAAARRGPVQGRRAENEEWLAGQFAKTAGWGDRADVVRVGEALLIVAGPPGGREEFISAIGLLVTEAMSHAGDLWTARSRMEGLDLGIAWTAHELRGPLVGARAALDYLLASGGDSDNDLLIRTRSELRRLTELVDPLLRWSAGSQGLDLHGVDLREIVSAAVDACELEHPHHRIAVEASGSAPVWADAQHLAGAISNVLRNALAYSPIDAPVRVVVARSEETASVCISDHGPGIAPGERDLIFDPFARGAAGERVRRGSGLGLFIARRVANAHGGVLRLLPSDHGATFCLELSLASEVYEMSEMSERRHASAS